MADEYVAVAGLRQAVLLAGTVEFHIRVEVTEVMLRQAPALREVFTKAARAPQHWEVVNDVKLRQLSRLANELDIVLDAVLPMLRDNLVDGDASRLLQTYGWSVRHLARKIVGTESVFYTAVASLGNLLRRHANHMYHQDATEEWLRGDISTMQDRIVEVKGLIVRLPPHGGGGGGGGGGGDDAGDEEEEDEYPEEEGPSK